MGILNVTPDSFSDGGRYVETARAVEQGLRLLDEGAEILDLGGESTRPGATAVTSEEETARVEPVLEALLRVRPEVILSVDTYHAATARRVLEMGAEIVNDVSGFLWDEGMAGTVAAFGAGCVAMHARGRPQDWAGLPGLRDAEVVPLVLMGLRESLRVAEAAGIARECVMVDPGFGFGKRGAENMALHAGLQRLRELGRPVLVGTSLKRFLGGGQEATVASGVAAVLAGAHVLRVHDVAGMRRGVAVADEVLARL